MLQTHAENSMPKAHAARLSSRHVKLYTYIQYNCIIQSSFTVNQKR